MLLDQAHLLGVGGVAYLLDKTLGIENEPINLHKSWLYGVGTIPYLAALNNFIGYLYSFIEKD